MMNGSGKSDRPIVPAKPPNEGRHRGQRGYGGPYTGTKAETPDTAKETPTVASAGGDGPAEGVEERGLAKGNLQQQNASRTPGPPVAIKGETVTSGGVAASSVSAEKWRAPNRSEGMEVTHQPNRKGDADGEVYRTGRACRKLTGLLRSR